MGRDGYAMDGNAKSELPTYENVLSNGKFKSTDNPTDKESEANKQVNDVQNHDGSGSSGGSSSSSSRGGDEKNDKSKKKKPMVGILEVVSSTLDACVVMVRLRPIFEKKTK